MIVLPVPNKDDKSERVMQLTLRAENAQDAALLTNLANRISTMTSLRTTARLITIRGEVQYPVHIEIE